ncbi:cytochrome c [Halobacteriovorax sp. JY17]|uniref:c-type cytochrome n=1 Tax=Halobacteriovorax sp. JY17 TaxID=2014617 RepID=UPI000C5242C2|nr:cytochrome c [Halobacteriovorax sp. JY17]PIK16005.1 MAG: cytochrome C-555 [Halobacteriovorax sp. JY17]
MKTILAVVALFALVSTQTFAADAARGQTLYKTCIQCHGANGEGNEAMKAPRIAGQHDWYIISSIKQFKAGIERKNPTMLPFIKKLSDADIEDLAAFISTLK